MGRLTDREFTDLLFDAFDSIRGGEDFITETQLANLFGDSSQPDELRAAAIRGFDAFTSLDVAHETNLAQTLGRGGFATSFGDGDVSKDDLLDYPGKIFDESPRVS